MFGCVGHKSYVNIDSSSCSVQDNNNNSILFQGLAKSVSLEKLSLANCPVSDEGLEGMYIISFYCSESLPKIVLFVLSS